MGVTRIYRKGGVRFVYSDSGALPIIAGESAPNVKEIEKATAKAEAVAEKEEIKAVKAEDKEKERLRTATYEGLDAILKQLRELK